ncbi:MAG: cytochrome c [Thermoleophilia bacterium]|nr:cytochrome c [Thermoleophilia bacterium]
MVAFAIVGLIAAITIFALGAGALLLRSGDEADTPPTVTGGDVIVGARVFATAGCGGCHTLQAAGSTGTTGPNLDEHIRSHDHSPAELFELIENGGVGMPAFSGRLSDREIRSVLAFVLAAASDES